MTVRYIPNEAETLEFKLYIDRKSNAHELTREKAEEVAQRIAACGGFAQVLLGGNVFEAYGSDPR